MTHVQGLGRHAPTEALFWPSGLRLKLSDLHQERPLLSFEPRQASRRAVLRRSTESMSNASNTMSTHGRDASILRRWQNLVPSTFIEFGPPHSRSQALVRGAALADREHWPIKKGHHRFVALAVWLPDKTLAETCSDFSDLGPDGCLYL